MFQELLGGQELQLKKVIDTPAGFVDIVPTFCEILGINTPSGLDGTSILPLLERE